MCRENNLKGGVGTGTKTFKIFASMIMREKIPKGIIESYYNVYLLLVRYMTSI